MNTAFLRLLECSPLVREWALTALFRATAAAFDQDMPRLRGLLHEGCLLEYARFTSERAGTVLQGAGCLPALEERLYRRAYRLGRASGWALGVRDIDDVMAAGRVLYGILDIDFAGDGRGDITVARCFFGGFYSPDVCRLMASMDAGLLAGLAGGGKLAFSERITEGRPCCRAHFELESTR